MHEFEGQLDGQGLGLALVVSRFHGAITASLLKGALDELAARGVADDRISISWVPGALELPIAAQWMARSGSYDAVITLGCVIRGETDHYDFVCSEATRGCGRVALTHDLPVVFGVLTCDTTAQAAARSGPNDDNKGKHCAETAVRMANLRMALGRAPGNAPESNS